MWPDDACAKKREEEQVAARNDREYLRPLQRADRRAQEQAARERLRNLAPGARRPMVTNRGRR